MVFLYFRDLIPTFVASVLFSALAMAHRILIPTKYSSFLQFKQEENEIKTAQSTVIRIIYLILGTLFLYKIGHFTEIQIATGIFISCFLNIWPVVIEHHLLKIAKTKTEWLLLLGYFSFIIFSILVEFITTRLLLPILSGDESIYWLDNQAISLFVSLVVVAIPIPVETIIAKFTHVVIVQRIDTFKEEVYICEKQLNMDYISINNNKYKIDDIAKDNDINIKLIETVIKLECFYRGRLYYRFVENILTKYFCKYAIKKDISVGIAQIKISTAQKILHQNPYLFLRKLCNDETNIELCGKYIKSLMDEYFYLKSVQDYSVNNLFIDIYDYIACQYLGGEPENKEKTILVYSAVLRSVLSDSPLYYIGSDGTERFRVTIFGTEKLSYERYKELKEQVIINGKICNEIFVNSEEFNIKIDIICRYAYQLEEIRKIAETHKLSVALE